MEVLLILYAAGIAIGDFLDAKVYCEQSDPTPLSCVCIVHHQKLFDIIHLCVLCWLLLFCEGHASQASRAEEREQVVTDLD